jgi:predicted ATPase
VKRFILTGTPGSGKTSLLRHLEIDGFGIVEEAATDVIALQQAQGVAEPWAHPSFLDAIVTLQRHREMRAASEPVEVQFHDRSVFCTAALADYIGFRLSDLVKHELERVREEKVFECRVLFVRNLGFVSPTKARRISYQESLRFEAIHERTYRDLGFELIFIEPGTLAERLLAIRHAIGS